MSKPSLVLPRVRRKRRRRRRRLILLVLALIAIGVLGWLGVRELEDRAPVPAEFSGP